MPTRPHIVLFIADDYSWHDMKAYGSPNTHTPNLDSLASQGMRFDAAFAASPTCTPSRSAMFTGLYPMRNGAHANHALIEDGLKTLPAYMQELGYRTVIAGQRTRLSGRVIRFGTMGFVGADDIVTDLRHLESTLRDLGYAPPAGAGVAAAAELLSG